MTSSTESLLFRPLLDSQGLEASWNFTVDWVPDTRSFCTTHALPPPARLCHFGLYPSEVADLLHDSDALELSLSLTSGQWDGVRWGVSPFHRSHGPDGGAVSASFPGVRVDRDVPADDEAAQRDVLGEGRARQRAMALHMRRWATLRRLLGELVNVPLDAAIPFAPSFVTAEAVGEGRGGGRGCMMRKRWRRFGSSRCYPVRSPASTIWRHF